MRTHFSVRSASPALVGCPVPAWRGRILLLSLLTVLTGLPDAGQAASGTQPVATLEFSGTIVAESCNVDNDSKNQNKYLGQFYASDFPSAGAVTQAVPFDIKLTNCTDNITGTRVTFSGAGASGNRSLLALTGEGTSGVASGLGVEVLDKNMNTIPINTTTEKYPLVPGDSNVLTFNLRYKSTGAVVTEGHAAATLFFDMRYQ